MSAGARWGVWLNVSQIDGPLPSASGAPSIWYAAVAAPHRNPSGNRSWSLLIRTSTVGPAANPKSDCLHGPINRFSKPWPGPTLGTVPIEIRPASVADEPAITQIRHETWLTAYAQIIDPEIIDRVTAPGGRASAAPRSDRTSL